MLYSCTHIATVGFKWLRIYSLIQSDLDIEVHSTQSSLMSVITVSRVLDVDLTRRYLGPCLCLAALSLLTINKPVQGLLAVELICA